MNVISGFWFLAGALCAAAVMLLLGPSLTALRRQSRWLMIGGLVAVFAAILLYLRLGSPEAIGSRTASATSGHVEVPAAGTGTGGAPSTQAAGSMDSVITSLEQRLRAKGGSDGDWELLAKSYEFLKRPDAAALARAHQLPPAAGESGSGAVASSTVVQAAPAPAPTAQPLSAESERALAQAEAARQKRDFNGAEKIYARLAAKDQMTAQSWADYADVTASLHNNSLAGKPGDYIRRALQLDPAQTKALWLQGSLEHETRQYPAAVATWRKLLAQMDPASSDAKLIQSNIDEDRRLGGDGATAAGAAPAAGVAVHGDVTLGAAMKARVKSGQTLYIVAKSVNSPGMPVAVRRLQTGTWPVTFELSDSDAMVPERKLSSVGPVTVEARISQNGQAASAPGDLLGATGALDPAKAGTVHLTIDREVR